MNGKKAKALRRLVRETSGNLPERAVKEYVWSGRVLPPSAEPRVNKPNTQHARYKSLKANYKRQMAE